MSTQTSDNNKTNSEKYFAALLPNAILDGRIVVYESGDIACGESIDNKLIRKQIIKYSKDERF